MIGNKVKSGLIIALACLVVVGLSACGGAEEDQSQLAEVVRGDLLVAVSADGNLSYTTNEKLTFGVGGSVAEINVKEGEWVDEGDVLARLDTTDLERTMEKAELDLEIAATSYRQLTYPYSYSTFAFDVSTALAYMADAQRELAKAEEALDMELSSAQYWEVWQGLQQAQNKLTEAEQKLARGQGEDIFSSGILRVTDFWTLRTYQLKMEKAQLVLDEAKENLEKAVIVAPFGGVVALVNVEAGDNIGINTVIIKLVKPWRMRLTAEVDEIDIPSVKLGQRAIVGVDALPELQFEGTVDSISSLATEESGLILYKVKINFRVETGSGIKDGMSATADIILDERTDVLLVPSRAIWEDDEGNPMVSVVVGERVEERAVVIGISDGYETEIIEGLEEGEIVTVERRASTGGGFMLGE
jgi:RND family efflux transporter MFP subunit